MVTPADEREQELRDERVEQAYQVIETHSEWVVDGDGWACVGCDYWAASDSTKAWHRADALVGAGWAPPIELIITSGGTPPNPWQMAVEMDRAEREMDKRFGYCSVCGRDLQLRKNGTVWHHRGLATGYNKRQYRCEGSGLYPRQSFGGDSR
jgi:hypothetical protein